MAQITFYRVKEFTKNRFNSSVRGNHKVCDDQCATVNSLS